MFVTRRWASVYVLLAIALILASVIGVFTALSLLGYTGFTPEYFIQTSFGSSLRLLPGFEGVANVSNTSDCSPGGLGIASQTFVISLPTRLDRRANMERLRMTLSLDFTYFDALPSDDPKILRIYETLSAGRAQLQSTDPDARGPLFGYTDDSGQFSWPPSLLEGSSWSTSNATKLFPDGSRQTLTPFERSGPITCATRNFTAGARYTSETPSYLVLTPAKVACWHSHLQVIRSAAEKTLHTSTDKDKCGDVTLVLEDDIDMERDIRSRLLSVWNLLPPDWDIVYLGECISSYD